jgi:hypothetical protein
MINKDQPTLITEERYKLYFKSIDTKKNNETELYAYTSVSDLGC